MGKITKKELIAFLDAFKDDVEIGVHCVNLIYPVSLSLDYEPGKGDRNGRAVIKVESIGTTYIATGQQALAEE